MTLRGTIDSRALPWDSTRGAIAVDEFAKSGYSCGWLYTCTATRLLHVRCRSFIRLVAASALPLDYRPQDPDPSPLQAFSTVAPCKPSGETLCWQCLCVSMASTAAVLSAQPCEQSAERVVCNVHASIADLCMDGSRQLLPAKSKQPWRSRAPSPRRHMSLVAAQDNGLSGEPLQCPHCQYM